MDERHRRIPPKCLDRRTLLGVCGALAAAGIARPAVARRRRQLGIVEITLARELSQDYAGAVRRLSPMGYTHFSFAMAAGGGAGPPRDRRRPWSATPGLR